MRILFALALCLGWIGAQTKPAGASAGAFDKPTLEAYVRHLLAMSPDVQVTISDPKPAPMPGMKEVDVHLSLGGRYQDETFYVTSDGKKILRGFIYDINQNPFQPELDKLKTEGAPGLGPAGAPLEMVVFSDFQCPNCKEEGKIIRQDLPAKYPKEVRVVFKDFPLEVLHPWAKAAAIDGRCAYRQSPAAFWKYHDWIYEHQGEITKENLKDKVLEWAKSAELDQLQLGRCMDTRATEAEVDKEIAEGRTLKVEGTPTIFLNGRRLVGNYPWANLDQLIDGELKYQQKSHDAAEKCCEVTIGSPVKK